jgi:hypothetical protein
VRRHCSTLDVAMFQQLRFQILSGSVIQPDHEIVLHCKSVVFIHEKLELIKHHNYRQDKNERDSEL